MKQFNLFKKIIDNKETDLKPEFFWMYQKSKKNNEEKIEKFNGYENYFGMSLLYAAIEKNDNPSMAMYLIQKMKETEGDSEYEHLMRINGCERTWANTWPNLGYAPTSYQATPLTVAVLKINQHKYEFDQEKSNDFKNLSRLLISCSATIENHDYYYTFVRKKGDWNLLLPEALEMERDLIKEIIEEKNNALLEAQKRIELLEAENKKLKILDKKRPLFQESQENEAHPSKKARNLTYFFEPTNLAVTTNIISETENKSTSIDPSGKRL